MKKKILILLMLIILSGCTVKENININADGSVSEKTNISFDNEMAVNYDTPTKYAEDFLKYYNNAIELKNYSYDVSENKSNTDVVFNRKTAKLCDGIKYGLFVDNLYSDIECSEDDYYYIIKSNSQQLLSKPMSEKKFDVERVELNIKVPIPLEENNADNVSNNTYTWFFDENTDSNKSVYLKINKTLLENKNKVEKEQKTKEETIKKNVSNIKIIGVIVVIFALLILIVCTLYKKYKNNKLEY